MIRLNLYSILLLLVLMAGCKKESFDDIAFADKATAPDQLSAMFNITQDNSGKVSIYPNGQGIAYFLVHFGDGSSQPAKVLPGKYVEHTYPEGNYNVRVMGIGVNGLTSEATQALTVSFRKPENLDFTVTIDTNDPFKVNLSAQAEFETFFRVYFGETLNEDPQSVLEGNTLSYTYAKTGTYTIRVVALSGGAASTELTKTITIVNPLLLPLDFEAASQSYDFVNFDGGQVTVIDNPRAGGLNTSSRVGRMVKNPGQPWGGSVISLGQPIDFNQGKVFRMKLYSPRVGAKVLLKVENISDGSISFEKEVTTTVANAWEDLAFDFNAINTTNSYQKLALIFELGTVGDGSENFTFLFDDIRLATSMPGTNLPISLPVSFDDPAVNYTVTDFGGNTTEDAADPVSAANKVKKTTKANGAETWAGVTIGTPVGFSSPIPFSASNTKMSVRVFSPAAGIPVLLKVEDHTNGNLFVEILATTTKAGEWETLEFDFSKPAAGAPALDLSKTYDKASIFFDFGSAGSGRIFYWDDVQMLGSTPEILSIPLNFQSTTLTYGFFDFDGGQATVVDNPAAGGINTSSKVGKMVKNPGQPWGGSFLTLDAPIDFSGSKTFKVKLLSPRVGARLLLKVENKDNGGINFEKEMATTKANEWEELSFDYSAINIANVYNRIVLIFDLGTQGDGSANYTFYFDDITLN